MNYWVNQWQLVKFESEEADFVNTSTIRVHNINLAISIPTGIIAKVKQKRRNLSSRNILYNFKYLPVIIYIFL